MRVKFKGRNYNAETLRKNLRQYVISSENIGRDLLWYQNQSEWISENKGDLDMHKSCGIFAALSPQMSVPRNEELFLQYLKHGKASHYGILNKKCDAIMMAESEEEVSEILNGNKISSFYLNLLHPCKETRVTIDRHAISCMTQSINNVKALDSNNMSMTDKQYSTFETIFKQVSEEIGMLAHELQAVTWVSYRQTRGLN